MAMGDADAGKAVSASYHGQDNDDATHSIIKQFLLQPRTLSQILSLQTINLLKSGLLHSWDNELGLLAMLYVAFDCKVRH